MNLLVSVGLPIDFGNLFASGSSPVSLFLKVPVAVLVVKRMICALQVFKVFVVVL